MWKLSEDLIKIAKNDVGVSTPHIFLLLHPLLLETFSLSALNRESTNAQSSICYSVFGTWHLNQNDA
jgi:hypothetical protein